MHGGLEPRTVPSAEGEPGRAGLPTHHASPRPVGLCSRELLVRDAAPGEHVRGRKPM